MDMRLEERAFSSCGLLKLDEVMHLPTGDCHSHSTTPEQRQTTSVRHLNEVGYMLNMLQLSAT